MHFIDFCKNDDMLILNSRAFGDKGVVQTACDRFIYKYIDYIDTDCEHVLNTPVIFLLTILS